MKKTRARIACDYCKRRKVKCDGEFVRPCSQCKKKKINCSWETPTNKRGRKKKIREQHLNHHGGTSSTGDQPGSVGATATNGEQSHDFWRQKYLQLVSQKTASSQPLVAVKLYSPFGRASVAGACVAAFKLALHGQFPFFEFDSNVLTCAEIWTSINDHDTPSITDWDNLLLHFNHALVFSCGSKLLGGNTERFEKFMSNALDAPLKRHQAIPRSSVGSWVHSLLVYAFYRYTRTEFQAGNDALAKVYGLFDADRKSFSLGATHRTYAAMMLTPDSDYNQLLENIKKLEDKCPANATMDACLLIARMLAYSPFNGWPGIHKELKDVDFIIALDVLTTAETRANDSTTLEAEWRTRLLALVYALRAGIYATKGYSQEAIFWADKYVNMIAAIFLPGDCIMTHLNLVIEVAGKFQQTELLHQAVMIYSSHTTPERGIARNFQTDGTADGEEYGDSDEEYSDTDSRDDGGDTSEGEAKQVASDSAGMDVENIDTDSESGGGSPRSSSQQQTSLSSQPLVPSISTVHHSETQSTSVSRSPSISPHLSPSPSPRRRVSQSNISRKRYSHSPSPSPRRGSDGSVTSRHFRDKSTSPRRVSDPIGGKRPLSPRRHHGMGYPSDDFYESVLDLTQKPSAKPLKTRRKSRSIKFDFPQGGMQMRRSESAAEFPGSHSSSHRRARSNDLNQSDVLELAQSLTALEVNQSATQTQQPPAGSRTTGESEDDYNRSEQTAPTRGSRKTPRDSEQLGSLVHPSVSSPSLLSLSSSLPSPKRHRPSRSPSREPDRRNSLDEARRGPTQPTIPWLSSNALPKTDGKLQQTISRDSPTQEMDIPSPYHNQHPEASTTAGHSQMPSGHVVAQVPLQSDMSDLPIHSPRSVRMRRKSLYQQQPVPVQQQTTSRPAPGAPNYNFHQYNNSQSSVHTQHAQQQPTPVPAHAEPTGPLNQYQSYPVASQMAPSSQNFGTPSVPPYSMGSTNSVSVQPQVPSGKASHTIHAPGMNYAHGQEQKVVQSGLPHGAPHLANIPPAHISGNHRDYSMVPNQHLSHNQNREGATIVDNGSTRSLYYSPDVHMTKHGQYSPETMGIPTDARGNPSPPVAGLVHYGTHDGHVLGTHPQHFSVTPMEGLTGPDLFDTIFDGEQPFDQNPLAELYPYEYSHTNVVQGSHVTQEDKEFEDWGMAPHNKLSTPQ